MIPIKNVYYMLSYAFKALNKQGYKRLAEEDFENVTELCAGILAIGVQIQIKRGLTREYLTEKEALVFLRGKIEIAESLKSQTSLHKRLICSYDVFLENSYPNRIIKTTLLALIKSGINNVLKKKLRKLLVYFANVDELDVHHINWKANYDRNDQTTGMLVSICYLAIMGMLPNESISSSHRRMHFRDDDMSWVYEHFILEYYRREFPGILDISAPSIDWLLTPKSDTTKLPIMKTDIMITDKKNKKILIIDTKFYSRNTRSRIFYIDDKNGNREIRRGAPKIHSANLYQIFTYIKNKWCEEKSEKKQPFEVSGMLLYAETEEEIKDPQDGTKVAGKEKGHLEESYIMGGNRIDVRTLDLNCDFADIRQQLNSIIKDFFGIEKIA